MSIIHSAVGPAVGLALLALPALAQDADSGPHWFGNPTPREHRRPLSADRPDATESPYTLDAGAVQLELSFVEYTYDDGDAGRTSTLDVAPFNLKFGLTESADLQFMWTPYTSVDTPGPDASGIGDLGLRLKINLWGNDEGAFAVGVMPFILFPTGSDDLSNDHIEGGVIIPVAFDLSESWGEGWGVGGQIEFDFVRDDANAKYLTEFSHTAVLGIPINDRFAAYLEYIGIVAIDEGTGYSPLGSAGLTYGINKDTQLDIGIVVGFDEGQTDDLRVFAGITKRF